MCLCSWNPESAVTPSLRGIWCTSAAGCQAPSLRGTSQSWAPLAQAIRCDGIWCLVPQSYLLPCMCGMEGNAIVWITHQIPFCLYLHIWWGSKFLVPKTWYTIQYSGDTKTANQCFWFSIHAFINCLELFYKVVPTRDIILKVLRCPK